MGDFQESMSMVHQAWVRFGPAFDRSRFATARTLRNQIGSHDTEQLFQQPGALTFGARLQKRFSKASRRTETAGKTDSLQRHAMTSGRFRMASSVPPFAEGPRSDSSRSIPAAMA